MRGLDPLPVPFYAKKEGVLEGQEDTVEADIAEIVVAVEADIAEVVVAVEADVVETDIVEPDIVEVEEVAGTAVDMVHSSVGSHVR